MSPPRRAAPSSVGANCATGAHRHWVRALIVAAAETTARGLAEAGFQFFAKPLPGDEEPTKNTRRSR